MSTTSRWIAAWTIALAATTLAASPTWAGQEEQFTPEFKAVRSAPDPKHTPKIVAPDTVKRGQWFDVTVSVGSGGAHPSLSAPYVRSIPPYLTIPEIPRESPHPAFPSPHATST